MKIYLLLFGCAATVFSAQAQENPAAPPVPVIAPVAPNEPEISFEQLIQRAQQSNPRLSIAQENLNAAQQRAGASRALRSPTLQLVPGLGGTREARDEEVILAQPLDVFGLRRARTAVADAEVRRAHAENNLAARALIIEVKNAAAALFAAQEAERLDQEQAAIAQLFRDAAARRAELGDVPPVQVQRAELELLRSQIDLSNAQSERLTRRAALNQLVGQPPATPLRVILPSESAPSAPANETSAARPDILSARATLAVRQAQADAIRHENSPTVELQARRSAFFGRGGSYSLRAVVTMPLFNFGAAKGQRRALEAEARAQEATVKLLEQQANAQVESAHVRLEKGRQNVARYREKLLPLTLELLRKTQVGYAQGASTYLEVLEAQRTLRQVQTEYLQALNGVQTAQTALEASILGGGPSLERLENQTDFSVSRGASR